jgi:hypothetical protein
VPQAERHPAQGDGSPAGSSGGHRSPIDDRHRRSSLGGDPTLRRTGSNADAVTSAAASTPQATGRLADPAATTGRSTVPFDAVITAADEPFSTLRSVAYGTL